MDWRDVEDNTNTLAYLIPGLLSLEIPVHKVLGLSSWDSIYVVVGLSWCHGKEWIKSEFSETVQEVN